MLSRLVERHQELPGIWTVKFTKPAGFQYDAGDYTELELAYPPSGGRRWFSLASSPSEEHLQITFKLPRPHSQFKRRLMMLEPSASVSLAPPMGNFNLPKKPAKVLLVATGIGATPFRSMVLDLRDKQALDKWDIKFIQAAKPSELLFKEVFESLGAGWLKTSPKPRLTPKSIRNLVPDMTDRMIFLAGPQAVTEKLHGQLAESMNLSQLRLSYFPGYKASDG